MKKEMSVQEYRSRLFLHRANYWFSTGKPPRALLSLFRTRPLMMPDLEGLECYMEKFNAPTERISDPIPVLFQSGYLTLKEYNYEDNTFTLGFPNEEVRVGFGKSLYNYVAEEYIGSRDMMVNAFRSLRRKKTTFTEFLESVRKWYAGIPYDITDDNQNGRSSESHQACLNGRVATDEDEVNEQFYQALFYALLVGIGADVHAEEKTSDGRMDISLKLPDTIYIIKFKNLAPSPSPKERGV